jgi:hypothetical protein
MFMKQKLLHLFQWRVPFLLLLLLAAFNSQAQLTYCATTNAGGGGSFINNVTFGSLSNNTSSSNPTSSPYYTLYTTPTTSLTAGSTVGMSITIDAPATYSGAIVSVWIDFNQNSVFEADQYQYSGWYYNNHKREHPRWSYLRHDRYAYPLPRYRQS